MDRYRKTSVVSVVAFFAMLFFCASAEGQSAAKQVTRPETDSQDIANQITWRSLLDELSVEARTLLQEAHRPYAQAEVADAYWNLDKTKSAVIFTSALESALTLKPGRQATVAIRHVLSLASKRDVALAKRLADKLAEERAKNNRSSSESIGAAIDLLRSDAEKAVELAEAVAPVGLSDDSAGVFILELAQRDLQASERVYRAYLSKAAAAPTLPLEHLLWLGGFPFGHGESYGFSSSNLTRLVGLGGRRISGLRPNPALATAFLNVAFKSVQRTLNSATAATPEKREALNGLCLFASLYLLPEVERYSPATLEAWWLMRQQAFAGTSELQHQTFEKQLQGVTRNRAVANSEEPVKTSALDEVDHQSSDAEKLPAGCARDRAYAKIALLIHSTKDDSRALRMAERIDNVTARDSVLQLLYYDISLTMLDADDWPQAQEYAKRVTAPEVRSLLLMKMATKSLGQKDSTLAAEFLLNTRNLANTISEQDTKAAVLLATAAAFSKFDPTQTIEVLREAIKAVNRTKNPNVDTFTVTRKVELSCPGDTNEMWYGSSETADRFSLMGTLTQVSPLDPEGMLAVARSLEEPSVRIRALASIIGSLSVPKPLTGPKPLKGSDKATRKASP